MSGSDRIVDRLRTAQSIAEWDAAQAFLDEADGLVVPACERVRSLVGHGLTSSEAEHISDLVRELRKDADWLRSVRR